MNRLDLAPSAALVLDAVPRFAPPCDDALRQQHESFFTPAHYESGYSYPLVVWLHGSGNCERQLASILPGISMRNFVGASVRASLPCYDPSSPVPSSPASIGGYAWRQSPQQIEVASECVDQLIASARRRYRIDPDRIFLAGQGGGGTMALRLALAQPRRFAGAISIGGGLPAGNNPFRELHAIRQLPLFLAGGAASSRYQSERVCEDLRLLHAAGVSVTLRHYPSGDEVHPQCLHDVNAWMMECLASRQGASIVR
ncbi:MAG: PHB depolymerase family esterase [Pirellulales bacterium]